MGSDDDEYEVVWSGRDPLLPPRESKPHYTWVEPRRIWNKKDGGEVEPPLEDDDGVYSGIVIVDDKE